MSDHLKKIFLDLLNEANEPEQIVALLKLNDEIKLPSGVVKKILKHKARQPNNYYETLSAIPHVGDLIDNRFDEFIATEYDPVPGLWPGPFTRLLRPNDRPVLLLPVRLETRFKNGQLCIRIYPDQIAVNSHEPRLTSAELKAGLEYINADDDDKQDAWRELARKTGPERGAWIVKAITDAGDDDPEIRGIDESWLTTPKPMLLPDRFEVYLYDDVGNLLRDPIPGNAVNKNITLFPAQSDNNDLYDDASKWIIDFKQAEIDGMGIVVPDVPADSTTLIKRLIVVGMGSNSVTRNQQDLEKLLDVHHYSTGMEFLKTSTPTNNTQKTSSGHSASTEDIENSYEVENIGPSNWDQSPGDQKSNAQRLGYALGLGVQPEKLRYLTNAGDIYDSYAKDMQTALWPATGDYYFRYLLPGILSNNAERLLTNHFIDHVRANGPLPSIRIGYQPYGILPVTKVRGFSASKQDNLRDTEVVAFDQKINTVLSGLFDQWFSWANNSARVPRVTGSPDPDQQLLQILSMEPVSSSYRARPFVDERFIAWLLFTMRETLFGPSSPYYQRNSSPLHWAYQWAHKWDEYRTEVADEWHTATSASAQQLKETPQMRLFAWWSDRDIETDVGLGIISKVSDENDADSELPDDYLRMLCDQTDTDDASKTLLRDLLRRSLQLAPDSALSAQSVQTAICNMATASLLEFFNAVTEPEQIVQRINDDPNFGSGSTRAYGVRRTLAQRILDTRATLPGGVFTTLQQIDDIFGVGEDTLHDIVFAFRDRSSNHDIDRLLRETLDLFTHRLDGWVTSLATKRLKAMREDKPTGIYTGAYGWVEDLSPSQEETSVGYMHAPSRGQAATTAVMHNAYLTHKNGTDANPFRINLNSHRVRQALRTMEGIRQGQPLGALLGYQFERALHENYLDEYIYDIRNHFPVVANKETPAEAGDVIEAVAARNVVDGLALSRWWKESGQVDLAELAISFTGAHEQQVIEHIDNLLETLDAVSDALMHEGVHHAVQGNYERGGAALEAAAGNAMPPEIESLITPVNGKSLAHRVCLTFHEDLATDVAGSINPRTIAEPRIAGLLEKLIPDLNTIGCSFNLSRVNINIASEDKLITLPGLNADIASAIVKYRDRHGEFKFLHHLKKLDEIDEALFATLHPWIMIGIDENDQARFYTRIDINSVTDPGDLSIFNGIDGALAGTVINNRVQNGEYSDIDELADTGTTNVPQETIDINRIWLTAGEDAVSLYDIGIDAIDLLYMSTAMPQGEETEIEQRLRCFIRNKYSLPHDTFIKLDTESKAGFDFSIDECFELCRYIFNALAAGHLLKPGMLSLPQDDGSPAFIENDVNQFNTRLDPIILMICEAITRLGGDPILDINGDPICSVTTVATSPDEKTDALLGASHFGIAGSIPAASTDPALDSYMENAIKELTRRVKVFNKLRAQGLHSPADDTETPTLPDKKMDYLVKAAKELFGGNLIILPVYTPVNTAALDSAFNQDNLLDGHDVSRVRLWLQQVAQVHPVVNSLENMLLMTEIWQQNLLTDNEVLLPVRLAQLPYHDNARWLALEDEHIHDVDEYGRGALSITAVVAGLTDALYTTTNLAGLMLEQWDELIPSDIINTSVAFHFNAPNTQAPQSLLLAVPGSRNQAPDNWTNNDLAEIVYDTLDLAKVRAVDIDAMREIEGEDSFSIGALLPGLMLPTDPDNPGWARDFVIDTVQEWDESIYMYGDIFLDGIVWRTESNIRISALGGEELSPGLFSENSSDSGTALLSNSGIRVELPYDVPKISITAGWRDTSVPEVIFRDASNNVINAPQISAEWDSTNPMYDSPQVLVLGAATLGTYHIYSYELILHFDLILQGIRSVEIIGPSLINHISTFRNV